MNSSPKDPELQRTRVSTKEVQPPSLAGMPGQLSGDKRPNNVPGEGLAESIEEDDEADMPFTD